MSNSEDFSTRKAELSPAKRALLQKWKRGELTINSQAQVIHRCPERNSLPLSFAQQRLWFLDQLEGESAIYNVPAAVRLEGSLQVTALEQAIVEIGQRHEVLRTNFPMVNGTTVQAIAPSLNISLPIVDLQSLPEFEQSTLVERLANEEAIRPFDLSNSPLLRVTLLRLGEKSHVLLVTMHHIVSDGWSIGIFIRELSALYKAFSTKAPSPLPELPIQYADFAVWQRQWLSGEVLETQLNYWKQQLAEAPPILELPSDRPRPTVQTFRGSIEGFELNPNLTRKLNTLSQQSGTTLFMILLAAFVTLLSRYSGQEDIVVGSPIANRHRREIESLIGFFVNTLVLRIDLKGNPSFSELLARVRQVALDAYAHQDLPFEHLVEALQPERSLSHSPLFQVMFVLQNAPMGKLELPGLVLTPLERSSVTAKFDLSLCMIESEQNLKGVWEYNTDLFESATIRRMVEHFQTLLEGIVANGEQHLQELPLLTATEQHQLVVEWNNTQTNYPQDKCIHQLFEEQSWRTSEAVAVVFADVETRHVASLTYQELNCRANQLAHHLQTLGVGPEVLVGICVERSLEMVVGLLGILKAGGAYVPLDPAYPQESLAFILSDTQVSVLLTQNHLQKGLLKLDGHIVCLDTDWEIISQQSEENPVCKVTLDNIAYVMYTSGSTGTPKGVNVIHRGVVRLVKQTNYASFSAEEIFLQLAPISFDASTFEIWGCLLNGARLVVMPPGTPSLQELGQALKQYHVTTLWLTANLFHLMVDNRLCDLKQVRQLLAGGDVLSVYHVQKVLQELKECRLINGYGPTENTTFTCCYSITEPSLVKTSVPIGRPIANTECFLLDDQLQPVAIGVPGELYIGGDGLARGYFNCPDLTALKFIPNPFSDQPGTRLYKTGDLARYLSDGNIEFLGRRDHQVKIRGFRIELAEIEAVLAQHPEVRETVVIAGEDRTGNKRLVAYVVSNTVGKQDLAPLLRRFLQEKLPNYMIPAVFVMLDALPLTPNGKVNRRALPAPDPSYLSLETSFVPPRNPTEETLAAIWTEVLGVERVGIHDNFFELGGDSILSIQIIARANQTGLQLTPKHLFQHQAIAQLAAVVTDTTQAIHAEQGLVTGQLPLTPIQHWFFEQNLPEPHHWNQAFLLEVQPDVNPAILERVVQQLLVHHDALRLRFVRSDSTWQQINTAPDYTVPFSVVDLSTLPEAEQESAIEATATQLQTTLNLSERPLVKVAFLTLGTDKLSRLLIVIHHLAVDGVSWRILLEDLETGYQQISRGDTIKLPPKTTSFKHWAERLRSYALEDALESEKAYWLAESWGYVPSLPVDYPGGANTEASARTVSVSLNVEETYALLQEVPKAYNTQINDVLLTALVLVFAKWTGFSSVLLNLEGHGREDIFEDVDLSRTIGWFTTIFPVLLKLEAIDNLGDALKSVKEQLRNIPNKGIGYGLLRYLSENAEIASQLRGSPEAEISFNYLGQFDQLLHTSTLFQPAQESIGPSHSPRGSRKHLLDVNGLIIGKQLRINWMYSENVHQQVTIERRAQEFLEALRSLIEHCLSPETGGYTPSDFPLARLSQDKLDQALASIEFEEQITKTNWKNIEQLYPLSPMQQGMLFHTLYAPKVGVYFVQLSCTLEGNLEVQAFQQAWQQVIARHSVLRTAFIWENQDTPLQVVYRQVKLPLQIHDWRKLSPEQQQQQWSTFLHFDRERGFKLSQAPLMRLTLIQVKEDLHQFLWSFHHLLMDGWSLHLVLKEVFAFYKASIESQKINFTSSYFYQDYIAWLQKQDLAKAETFWRQLLKGFTAPTPLAVDRALTNLPSDKSYSEQQIQLTQQATEDLQSFARQHQLTVNTLVQGAWALLLSRYSGERDVVFGVTVSGRAIAIKGVESIVGLFINTLPMRVQVSNQDSPLSWLKQIQNQQVEISQYDYSSLVEIHQMSEVPRGQPLFESIVVFENYPIDASLQEQGGNLELGNVRAFERTNYPLTVVAVPGAQLSLRLNYDCHRFDAARIARMCGHLQTLLLAIVTNPNHRLSELPLLSAAEQQLLQKWNDTRIEHLELVCIHQQIEAVALQTPDAVAVVCEDEQITYQQLNQSANQLAHYLIANGVKPEMLVGICTERCGFMVVAMLAILKAGGAYLPLDPNYPQQRLALMREDAQVSVVITTEHLVSKLRSHFWQVICVDSQWHSIAQHSQHNPQIMLAPENLAYAIYTSGSTGKPKAVAVSHQSLFNLVLWHQQAFSLSPKDRTTQMANAAFDACGWEIWPPLAVGASIHIVNEQIRSSPTQLQDWLLEQGITISFVPTPLAQAILALPWPSECGLRIMLTGGDKLQQHPPESLPFALINNYGPTENTVVTTSGLVAANELASSAPTIGRPISNTQVYLLDENLQPVPIGVVGELYIGGDNLARGYLNHPQLTTLAFIPDPYNKQPGSRLYKTGDLGRYLSNGNIEYVGRIDNQVKLRGLRIELGEIEAVLSQHPDVLQCVVIVQQDAATQKRLVAYVVTQQQSTLTNSQLRHYIKQKLPEYMLPSSFVFLDSLPLTPNGKVDRNALRTLEMPRGELSPSFVAPQTSIEEMLAYIWAEVLGIEQVGIEDNFFELGGHSLIATQLVSRVRTTLKVELPLRSLFEAPTIKELAQCIQKLLGGGQQLLALPLLPSTHKQAIPLSFAQGRLWFLDQLQPGTATYNIPVAVRLQGHLNVSALEESLNCIINRHEALRTNFIVESGQPTQVIAETLKLTLPVVDLRCVPEAQRESISQQLASQQAVRPFDLASEPLVRATLLQLAKEEHVLLVVMHHLICDGWSMSIFVRELACLYNALSTENPTALPQLPIQYADFAFWQRQWLQNEKVLETQLSYWKQQLCNATDVLQLPTDRPRPAVKTFRGAYQRLVLPVELSDALRKLSQRCGVTLFMTLLAAFVTLLYRYSGQSDICVGTPIANRNRAEIEGLIGLFVNTLVLRTNLAENPSFCELLDRVREVALGAYAHQDMPFEQLVEILQPERNLSHQPLFQVMFVLQNAPMSSGEFLGLTLTPLEVETATAKFDLTLSLEDTEQGLSGSLEYNTDLFDAATIARMCGHLQTLLLAIVTNPNHRLSELPLLSAAEQQLLQKWNDTRIEHLELVCIHQQIEAVALQTPDAVAVVCEDEQITYQQLNQSANQLAHYLIANGVKPEMLVGICTERCGFMVVAMLAILKAGGAYLPLDPNYPQQRLALMREDAQVSVVITTEHLVSKLRSHFWQVICVDSQWHSIAQHSQHNPQIMLAPENLAYAIYTSGSTGKPKAVAVSHQSLFNLVLWHQQAFSLSPKDRTTQMANAAFDACGWEIWPPLAVGASIHIVNEQIRSSPTQLQDWLLEQGITISFVPTPLAQAILALPWPSECGLRIMLTGGDKLQQHPPESLPFALINNYGPTENTVVTTSGLVAANELASSAPTIGRPISNTQVYLLDENLQPVPIGVVGELYIGGDNLARGYLNHPQLTTLAFIPDPYNKQPGSRLYKTGDLGRYLSNGNIEYVGRIDNQVKLRGLRIELGEIEAVLSQHPDVLQCVVIVQQDAATQKRLVAYVVAQGQTTKSNSQLRHYIKQKLPEYMLPSSFVFLDSLPLTPNGKVDRNALPAPNRDRSELEDAFVAPRDTLELQLAHIWEDILDVSPIGVTNNFFELGGHSLLAVRLIAQIQKQFGQDLPLTTLFQGATIDQQARILRQQISSPSWSPLVAIQPGGSQRPFFCVHPAGGNVLCYYDLARCLGSDQPFYGLQARGLDGQQDPHTTVEDTAACYIEALRVIQPEGPYFIGGWSYGGFVAFEMALQLVAQGQQVALLALLDSDLIVNKDSLQEEDDVENFVGLFQEYYSLSLEHPEQLGADEQILYVIEQVKQSNLLPSDFDLPQARSFIQVYKANIRAAQNYVPQRYPGRVTLFRAAEQLAQEPEDLTMGLGKLAEGVDIHIVPGKHLTMLQKPNVQVLAEQLKRCLEQAQINPMVAKL